MGRSWSGACTRRRARGAAMLFTPEMSGLLDRDRERAGPHLRGEADDPVLAAVREAAAEAGIWVHLGSLALLARTRRQARQSRLRDRRCGRDPRPLRQDPPLRRRPADRRELARIGRLSRRRPRRRGRHPARPARPLDLLRPALRRPLFGAQQLRRDRLQHPRRLHRADRRGALARFDARPGDRGRRVRRRRRAGRAARGRPDHLRPFAGRRSLGAGAA